MTFEGAVKPPLTVAIQPNQAGEQAQGSLLGESMPREIKQERRCIRGVSPRGRGGRAGWLASFCATSRFESSTESSRAVRRRRRQPDMLMTMHAPRLPPPSLRSASAGRSPLIISSPPIISTTHNQIHAKQANRRQRGEAGSDRPTPRPGHPRHSAGVRWEPAAAKLRVEVPRGHNPGG